MIKRYFMLTVVFILCAGSQNQLQAVNYSAMYNGQPAESTLDIVKGQFIQGMWNAIRNNDLKSVQDLLPQYKSLGASMNFNVGPTTNADIIAALKAAGGMVTVMKPNARPQTQYKKM